MSILKFSLRIAWYISLFSQLVLSEPIPITICISYSIPPYVIANENRGIEIDILEASLTPYGYKITPVYLLLARTITDFESGNLDGIINIKEGLLNNGFYTDEAITFQNVTIHRVFPQSNYRFAFNSEKLEMISTRV